MSDLKDFVIENGVLKKYVGTDANVTITEDVFQIGPNAFENNENIVCVTLPNKLTSIGANAFRGCVALSEISIPSNVTQIGNNAFDGCSSLVSIAIPVGVTQIEKGLFKHCTSLTSVILPEGITSIGEHEFRYNFDGAFEYCESLKNINLPESLKLIGANTFRFCTSLESVVIPQNMEVIGYDAFVCCGIKTIEYPLSDNDVCAKTTVFSGCDNIETIIAPTTKAYNAMWKLLDKDIQVQILRKAIAEYTDDDNIIKKIKDNRKYLFDYAIKRDDETIVAFIFSLFEKFSLEELNEYIKQASWAPKTGTLMLEYKKTNYPDESVEAIEFVEMNASDSKDFVIKNGELTEYTGLGGNVIIPNGVTAIGSNVFFNNNTIESVVLPEGVESIGNNAFCVCLELKSVCLPNSLTTIGGAAFSYCENLSSITIPESVTNIDGSAFKDCKNLTNLVISENITNIGAQAFRGCEALKDKDGFIIVNGVLYDYCGNDTNIIIPDGVVEIGDDAFCGHKFNSLNIPSSVTKLGKYVFLDCQSFKKLIILGNITSIDTGAFKNGLPRYIYAPNMSIEYIKNQKLILPAAMGFLLYHEEFTDETTINEYTKYISAQKKKLLPLIFEDDIVAGVAFYANSGKITAQNFEEEFLLPAQAAKASQCIAFLVNWKNENISQEAIENNLEKQIDKDPFNVTDMKKVWSYKKQKDGTLAITGYKGNDINIVIPERIGKDIVTEIDDEAFSATKDHRPKVTRLVMKNIQSIIIPETVKSIGVEAFGCCTSLTDIIMPDGVKKIGKRAFWLCNNLTNVNISNSVSTIDIGAFAACPVTIHAPAGSYAEQYAKENNIPFVAE